MPHSASDHYSSADEARARARAALSPRPPSLRDDRWSKVITFLRVALPGAAVALALVTLIWPFLNTTEVAFTLAKDEVTEGDGRVRMTNLEYVGTDSRGRLFRITAGEGEQEDPSDRRVRLSGIDAEMALGDQTPISAKALSGLYRIDEGSLSLVGQVQLDTRGYALTMSGAEIDLKSKIASGEGQVRGAGPLGDLQADRVTVNVEEQVGVFEGAVKVHIVPARPAGAR